MHGMLASAVAVAEARVTVMMMRRMTHQNTWYTGGVTCLHACKQLVAHTGTAYPAFTQAVGHASLCGHTLRVTELHSKCQLLPPPQLRLCRLSKG